MSEYRLAQIDFDTILPIWAERLWPNRKSIIQSASSMVWLGGYDKKIYEYIPVFFGVYSGDRIVGVNSGFQTAPNQFRSRGIWTDPEHLGKGVGTMLLAATAEAAKAVSDGPVLFWTIPRKTAMTFYARFGFEQVSAWFDEGMEFGPNCFARMMVAR